MFGSRLLTPTLKTLATTAGATKLTPSPSCGLLVTLVGAYTTPTAVTVAPPTVRHVAAQRGAHGGQIGIRGIPQETQGSKRAAGDVVNKSFHSGGIDRAVLHEQGGSVARNGGGAHRDRPRIVRRGGDD